MEEEYEVKMDEFDSFNLLNVYLYYFKQLFQKNNSQNMFDEINCDEPNSTNRCLEFLYDEIRKCNENVDKTAISEECNFNIDECDELYLLKINGESDKYCQYLLPLLKIVAEIDWTNVEWSINPLKSEY